MSPLIGSIQKILFFRGPKFRVFFKDLKKSPFPGSQTNFTYRIMGFLDAPGHPSVPQLIRQRVSRHSWPTRLSSTSKAVRFQQSCDRIDSLIGIQDLNKSRCVFSLYDKLKTLSTKLILTEEILVRKNNSAHKFY